MNCRYQSRKRKAKVRAKEMKPRIASSNSPEVRGTSRATISRVMAKAKTASLNPSSREISRLRQRNSWRAVTEWRSMSLSRSMWSSLPAQHADLLHGGEVLRHLGDGQRAADGREVVPDLAHRPPAVHQVQGLVGVLAAAAPQPRPLRQSRRRDPLRRAVVLEPVIAETAHRAFGIGRAMIDHIFPGL